MRNDERTVTLSYRMFDPGEIVVPLSPRCPLADREWTVVSCEPPVRAGEDAQVFVEGYPDPVNAELLCVPAWTRAEQTAGDEQEARERARAEAVAFIDGLNRWNLWERERVLDRMPTLARGQDAELKWQNSVCRVWRIPGGYDYYVGNAVSRGGEPCQLPIQFETCQDGRWIACDGRLVPITGDRR